MRGMEKDGESADGDIRMGVMGGDRHDVSSRSPKHREADTGRRGGGLPPSGAPLRPPLGPI